MLFTFNGGKKICFEFRFHAKLIFDSSAYGFCRLDRTGGWIFIIRTDDGIVDLSIVPHFDLNIFVFYVKGSLRCICGCFGIVFTGAERCCNEDQYSHQNKKFVSAKHNDFPFF